MNLLSAFTASKRADVSALVNRVHHADCFELMAALPDGSVSLIATDPPYNGVKDEEWDNQWATDADYLAWIGRLCQEWKRILKPNGSLYVFASPRMAARVEVKIAETFNVLNRITWAKPMFSTKAEMFDKDTMRAFFPSSEAIVFAEQWGADASYQGALIDENSDYWTACEVAKRGIFGDYLTSEFRRAAVTNRQIAALFPSATGGLTGCVSNWLLGYNCPTPEQYQKMRQYLNSLNVSSDYLRREYEDLRREYEDLRREYEDLRRPFNGNPYAPYTDVWTFPTVQAYPGKHPCEKPLALMKHIVTISSRPGDVVFDGFCGSGATLDAARQLGRQFIGCDFSEQWARVARKRVILPFNAPLLFPEVAAREPQAVTAPLFE